MSKKPRISVCLWFDGQAEEAANFYIGIFPNSRITNVTRYSKAGQEIRGNAPNSVMMVNFELDGQPFAGLNGGPQFKFSEAISFPVICETQDEIDYYWGKLSEGGDKKAQQCGWLKDKFGVSWQVVSPKLLELLHDADSAKAQRTMNAMMKMKKLNIAELERA